MSPVSDGYNSLSHGLGTSAVLCVHITPFSPVITRLHGLGDAQLCLSLLLARITLCWSLHNRVLELGFWT